MSVGHLQRQKAIRGVHLLVAALVAVQVLTPFMSSAAAYPAPPKLVQVLT